MNSLIALRASLPYDVPPGGRAVALVDGRIAPKDPLQGPGRLTGISWRGAGRRVEAVVLPSTTFSVRLDLQGLQTARETARVSLKLALEVADPIRFVHQVVGGQPQIREEDIAQLLRDAVRSGLAHALRQRSLADLYGIRPLSGWLGTVVEACLRGEVDLLTRSGLTLLGVEAFDLQEQAGVAPGRPEVDREADARRRRAEVGRGPEALARFWLDRPELDGLWRAFCPRCLTLAMGGRCPRCGWEWTAGSAPSQPQPRLQVGGRVDDVFGGLSILGDQLCVTAEDGQVILLGRTDLKEQQRTALEWNGRSWLPSAQVAGDAEHIYLGCANPDSLGDPAPLLALRRVDLALAWAVPTGGRQVSGTALYDGVVYAAASNDEAWAVAITGKVRWRQPLGVPYSPQPPAVDDELVIFPSRSQRIVALDRLTGDHRWSYESPVQGAELRNTPLSVGDRVYVAGWDGCLACVERRDGRLLWRYPAESGQAFLTPPVAVGSLVLVGGQDRRLHAVRDLGDRYELAWTYHIGDEKRIYSRPVVIEDVAYLAGDDQRLHAVDLKSGQPLWPEPLTLGERVRAALASAGWHVVVVGVRGTVWAAPRHLKPLGVAATYEAEGRWDLAAAAHVVSGDYLKAAELCLDRLGFPEAALALARASDPAAAAGLFIRLGRRAEAARLYEQMGNSQEAARLWEQEGEFARAVDLYRRDGSRPALERALELCRQSSDARQEAAVLAALGRCREAGDVIQAQAQRLETETRGQAEEELATLWELADGYYRDAGPSEGANLGPFCRQKVAYYRKQPALEIAFLPGDRPFVVDEINRLRLVIRNLGRGLARDVRLTLRPALDAVEGELTASVETISPRGGEWGADLNIMPRRGGLVALRCLVEYLDIQGQKNCLSQQWEIEVQGQRQVGPQIIHVHGDVHGGQFVQSGRDTIIAGNDLLQSGAQKGDRVTIDRRSLAKERGLALPGCRRCGQALVAGAAYCDNCGEEVLKA
jgi:outer membrane protein assembly factor BamB